MTVTPALNPEPTWGSSHGGLDLRPPVAASRLGDTGDRLLIAETIHRYGWGYDERQEDVLADCFTEDCIYDGSVAGSADVGPFNGRAAIMSWLRGYWDAQTDQRRHIILNLLIDDLTAESANALSYLMVTGAENGIVRVITTGFYRAAMIREGEIWRIRRFFAGFDTAF